MEFEEKVTEVMSNIGVEGRTTILSETVNKSKQNLRKIALIHFKASVPSVSPLPSNQC